MESETRHAALLSRWPTLAGASPENLEELANDDMD